MPMQRHTAIKRKNPDRIRRPRLRFFGSAVCFSARLRTFPCAPFFLFCVLIMIPSWNRNLHHRQLIIFIEKPFLFFRGNNLQPIPVRICDKINSHRFVFVANTVHFLMQRMSRVEIFCFKGKMELILSKVIGLSSVLEPCQLQLMRGCSVAQINQCKIRLFLAPNLFEPQRFLVKSKAFV